MFFSNGSRFIIFYEFFSSLLNSLAFSNPSISKLLPKDYESFAIITAMCSCDLYSSPSKPGEKEKEKETLRRKYKKKGWSENKIQRALNDHDKNIKVRREGFRDDFFSWLSALSEKADKSLFIFIHFYGGELETEELNIVQSKVKAIELRSLQQQMAQDVLLEITN